MSVKVLKSRLLWPGCWYKEEAASRDNGTLPLCATTKYGHGDHLYFGEKCGVGFFLVQKSDKFISNCSSQKNKIIAIFILK